MSSVLVLILALVIFTLAYRFYGRFLSKVFDIDPEEPTPAHEKHDGIDFVASRHWLMLFGHHFSSISGAGPIIGPVLACVFWGWGPTFLWILVGSVLVGGVHDFGSLVISIKSKGNSIAAVSESIISKRAKILFSIFVWLALILVIAIFLLLASKTYVDQPKVVIPSFGLIFIALGVGYFLYYLKRNQVIITIVGLLLFLLLIFIGNLLPLSVSNPLFWMVLLIIYCYIASITPVQILLQPRDYLSAFLLFIGIMFGIIGIVVTNASFSIPMVVEMGSEKGGFIWPMLFVTVACGAVSGFHSVVASGTTSKQISNQRDAVKIGYGGMLVEGVLAVIALIAVGAGVSNVVNIKNVVNAVNIDPIELFSKGYGYLTKSFLGGYGSVFAATLLNVFILTTLDSATRITRYISEELFNIKNRYLSTFVVILFSAGLAYSGQAVEIWPVFGASNQLVAALALIVVSAWVLSKGKNAWYIIIPTVFMLFTTIGALVIQMLKFFNEGNVKLLVIIIALILLAIFLLIEAAQVIRKLKRV
ncbi:MAG: carbon starvation CstA family protein [bacterium]